MTHEKRHKLVSMLVNILSLKPSISVELVMKYIDVSEDELPHRCADLTMMLDMLVSSPLLGPNILRPNKENVKAMATLNVVSNYGFDHSKVNCFEALNITDDTYELALTLAKDIIDKTYAIHVAHKDVILANTFATLVIFDVVRENSALVAAYAIVHVAYSLHEAVCNPNQDEFEADIHVYNDAELGLDGLYLHEHYSKSIH